MNTQILQLADSLLARDWRVVTAESCTGGGVAAQLTELAGSSAWLEGGFVTYSNAMKQRALGISPALIEQHGAVSQQCVEAMATGALDNSLAQISVAISGIAGPGGGSEDKPVGTVWIAWATVDPVIKSQCYKFNGARKAVRDQAVEQAISGLLEMISG
ncbi:MAG: CinA family protein [Motiliproteus sp.]